MSLLITSSFQDVISRRPRSGRVAACAVVFAAALASTDAARSPSLLPGTAPAPRSDSIPYADAREILDALQPGLQPLELRGKDAAQLESIWLAWIAALDRTIRKRVSQGDEDSAFNLLLLGTTFTEQPRVPDVAIAVDDTRTAAVVRRRLDDLVAALASGRGDERLQLVRELFQREGIPLTAAEGSGAARSYLVELVGRLAQERDEYRRAAASANQLDDPVAKLATHATLYRRRGLSGDTSVFSSFAVDQALHALKSASVLGSAPARHVGLVGPGLDFIDKDGGYDFYPLQTIQPFAAIDSLLGADLTTAGVLRLTTFDVSSRINHHLEAARRRAAAGTGYVLTLPKDARERWTPELAAYWQHLGGRIGEAAVAARPPANAWKVDVRAVRVRAAVLESIDPVDMDIVTSRLVLADSERFDLMIATNVLVYYDVFEQSLALANIAAMLRPGGVLLVNDFLHEMPSIPMSARGYADAGYTDAGDGDRVFWYQRR